MKKTTQLLFILISFFCFSFNSLAQTCQDFDIEITNISSTVNQDGYIYLCIGETLDIDVNGIYNNNDINYNQADSTTNFTWFTHNEASGNITNSLSTSYNEAGIYPIVCQGIDVNNCESTNKIILYAIVSGATNVELSTSLPDSTYCTGDSLILMANTTFDSLELVGLDTVTFTYENDTPVFIPDGTGELYTSTINVPSYMDNSNIQLENMLVCVEMEHSFVGDLEILLICPDGTEMTLHEFSNFSGGGFFLGEPVDDGSTTTGVPYTYCWTPFAENGTWTEVGIATSLNLNGTLPAGDYSPYESFDEVLGCANGGDWTISFEDLWGADDGYMFSWSLGFIINDSLLFQDVNVDTISYLPQMVDQYWELPDGTEIHDSQASIEASNEGYTYHLVDDLGCNVSYDLALVFDEESTCLGCIPYPNSSVSLNICPGDSLVFEGNTFYDVGDYSVYPDTTIYCVELIDVTITEYNIDYELEINPTLDGINEGSIGITFAYYIVDDNGDLQSSINNLAAGTYTFDVSYNGCITADTAIIESYFPLVAEVTLGGDPITGQFAILTISDGYGDYTIEWSTGENDVYIIDLYDEGIHSVTVTDELGNEITIDFYVGAGCATYPNSTVSLNICPGDSLVFEGNTFYEAGNYTVYPDTTIYCPDLIDVTVTEYIVDYELSIIPELEEIEDGSVSMITDGYYIMDENGNPQLEIYNLTGGTYIFDILSPDGCTVSDTVFVDTYPLLLAQVEISDGFTGSSTFSAEVFITGGWGNYTIEWSTGETGIVVIDGLEEGNYWVTITDELGNEVTVNFYAGNSSSNDLSIFNSINIHPNPVNNVLHINATFDNTYDYNFAIYDLLGKRILSKNGNSNHINTSENMEEIPTGIYLLRLVVDGNIWTEKLVIE